MLKYFGSVYQFNWPHTTGRTQPKTHLQIYEDRYRNNGPPTGPGDSHVVWTGDYLPPVHYSDCRPTLGPCFNGKYRSRKCLNEVLDFSRWLPTSHIFAHPHLADDNTPIGFNIFLSIGYVEITRYLCYKEKLWWTLPTRFGMPKPLLSHILSPSFLTPLCKKKMMINHALYLRKQICNSTPSSCAYHPIFIPPSSKKIISLAQGPLSE